MRKRIRLIGLIIVLGLIIGACGKEEAGEVVLEKAVWSDCLVYYTSADTGAEEAANSFAETMAGEETPETYANEDIGIEDSMYLGGETLAQKTGTDISGVKDLGFLITNDAGTYYVYAKSEKGFNRALEYMDRTLFSEFKEITMLENTWMIDLGDSCVNDIMIGETGIEEYTIVIEEEASEEMRATAEKMQAYVIRSSGIIIPIEETSDNIKMAIHIAEISSSSTDFTYKYTIAYGKIQILGKDIESCQDGVYDLLNTYFGWSFAGEEREKMSSRVSELHIPSDVLLYEDEPWKEEREAIVCLWKMNFARGVYLNQHTSLLCDLMSYSDDQLYEYVKMLKHCGYTGVQVTDMCSAWAGSGDYDYVHERLRIMADAAHSMGMNFTLWLWGAEFDGYDWVDEDVYYDFEGYTYLQENPRAIELFDEYYSIYAELADCTDRVIGHYYDPGNLYASEDIGFFANMLKEKFQAINPDIDFGVNCWAESINKEILVEYLGNDVTLYEGASDLPGDMVNFRASVDSLECRLGTWSWGKAEAEVDQLAQMSINAKALKEVYQNSKLIDESYQGITSEYWSEMDSYHVLNVFSLYCAGHLLANPDADPEELLHQISYQTVGDTYENDFYEILDLIQDARTGDSTEYTYWKSEDYIYINESAYDAADILERCNTYIPILDQMIEEEIEAYSLPMPIDLNDTLKLMRPQLEQIRKFAEFRLAMYDLEEDYENGFSQSELHKTLEAIYEPIPEYNAVIGLWGQVESRVQYIMIEEFCEKAGIDVPDDPVFIYYRKMRIYQHLCSFQKGMQEPYLARTDFYQWGVAYGSEETSALVEELVEEGLFTETEEGKVYLTDWENYIFDFN